MELLALRANATINYRLLEKVCSQKLHGTQLNHNKQQKVLDMSTKKDVTVTLTAEEAKALGKLLKVVQKHFGGDVKGQDDWDNAGSVCRDLEKATAGTWVAPLVHKICN